VNALGMSWRVRIAKLTDREGKKKRLILKRSIEPQG
jgi:hypothetical protein